ncbi:MAG: hypothetical protein L3J96_03845, partial [Thermoplasmata archaeon]|nr:hypothetical protein [Thermoplasmata archaeon]
YYSLDPFVGGFLNSSSIHLVRWPGGAIADRYNLTSNQIYSDSGAPYSPPSSAAQFVNWCRSAHCHAIVQLPGEIDSPSTAAYDVHFFESTLQFHPDSWEIGNEPALWTHFGSPWFAWSPGQSQNATPGSYAKTVQQYAIAMKAVDPNVRIIGLPGVGTGSFGESSWIRATVGLNGPNLSGVAIHVYPAGSGPLGSATLDGFDRTLTGAGSLVQRVPADRAAILQGCPSCKNLPLLVTELGSANEGGSFQPFLAGFAEVPYITAEIVQAMSLNLSTVALFAAQGTYAGSLLTPSETPMTLAPLYQIILHRVQHVVLPQVVVSRSVGSSLFSLLVSNTNTSNAVRISLSSLGLPLTGTSSIWTWDAASSQPLGPSQSASVAGFLTIPTQSVLLLLVSTYSHLPVVVPAGVSTVHYALLAGPSMSSLIALFGVVAPTGLTMPCWASLIPESGRPRFHLPEGGVVAAWLWGRL